MSNDYLYDPEVIERERRNRERRRQQQLRAPFIDPSAPDPEEEGRIRSLADRSGMPEVDVRVDLGGAEAAAAAAEAERALAQTPRLRDWLGDPRNAAIARDDIDNLSVFERAFGGAIAIQSRRESASLLTDMLAVLQPGLFAPYIVARVSDPRASQTPLGNLARRGGRDVEQNALQFARAQAERPHTEYDLVQVQAEDGSWRFESVPRQVAGLGLSEEEMARLDALVSDPEAENWGPFMIGPLVRTAPQIIEGYRRAGAGAVEQAGEVMNGAPSPADDPRSLALVAPALGAGAAGFVQGYVASSYEAETGSVYDSLRRQGIAPDIALRRAEEHGRTASAIEVLGGALGFRVNPFARLGGRALSSPTMRVARPLLRAGGEVGEQMVEEGGEETLQYLSETIHSDLALQESEGAAVDVGRAWRNALTPERLAELLQAFSIGAQAGGGMGTPAATINFGLDMRAMRQAEEGARVFEQYVAAAQASRLGERRPEDLASAVDAMTQGRVFIDADQFVEHFQNLRMDPYRAADDIGLGGERLRQALAAHGQVEVSAGVLAARVLRDPAHASLAEAVRVAPDADTIAETRARAENAIAAYVEEIKADADRAQAASETAQIVEEQFMAAAATSAKQGGMNAQVARPVGRMLRAMTTTALARAQAGGADFAARMDAQFRGLFQSRFEVRGPNDAGAGFGGETLEQRRFGPPKRSESWNPPEGVRLTEHQRAVAEMAVNGAGNQWIAEEMETSAQSVKATLDLVRRQLGGSSPWEKGSPGSIPGTVARTGERTATVEELVGLRERLRLAGFYEGHGKPPTGMRSMTATIAERTGLTQSNVKLRLWRYDKDVREGRRSPVELGQDGLDTHSPTSLRALNAMSDADVLAWYDANVRLTPTDEGVHINYRSDDALKRRDVRLELTDAGPEAYEGITVWRGRTERESRFERPPTPEEVNRGRRMMIRLAAVVRGFLLRDKPKRITFSGATEAHDRMYRTMLTLLRLEGYEAHQAATTTERNGVVTTRYEYQIVAPAEAARQALERADETSTGGSVTFTVLRGADDNAQDASALPGRGPAGSGYERGGSGVGPDGVGGVSPDGQGGEPGQGGRTDPVADPAYRARLERLRARFGQANAAPLDGQERPGTSARGNRGNAQGPAERILAEPAARGRQFRDIVAASGVKIHSRTDPLGGQYSMEIDTPFAMEADFVLQSQDKSPRGPGATVIDFDLVDGYDRQDRRLPGVYIRYTSVHNDAKSTGVGLWLYRQLIDWADELGLSVYSDASVSARADKVYPRLREAGYTVQPFSANVEHTADGLVATDYKPIYVVSRRRVAVRPMEAAPPPDGGYQIDGPGLRERIARSERERPPELGQSGDDPVLQAQSSGYEGSDTGEAREWLSAVRKGLPMDQASRMARAKAMGFDVDRVLYHGTFAAFEAFDQRRQRDPIVGPYSIYLSEHAPVASDYANGAVGPYWMREGGNVIPAFARGPLATKAQWDSTRDSTNAFSTGDRVEVLRAQGYRGVRGRLWLVNDGEVAMFSSRDIRSIHAAFDPDQSDSANLLAQQPDAQVRRGALRYDGWGPGRFGEAMVRLFDEWDPSTPLHEVGGHLFHLILESMATDPDAPADIKQMWADTLSWWGVDQATWSQLDFEGREPYFERFARTFEAYMMEGKAPSLQLRDVFQTFMRWLLAVYRDIRSGRIRLKHNLTPEIRSVFDRLLATDAEIAEARAHAGADVKLKREHFRAMSDEEWAGVEAAYNEALAAQEAEARARTMAAYARKHKRWFRAEREARRDEARRDVDADPARRAEAWLSAGEWAALPPLDLDEETSAPPPGAMLDMPDGGLVDMRLDPAALEAQWPDVRLPASLRQRTDLEAVLAEAMALKRTTKERQPQRLWAFIKAQGGIDLRGLGAEARDRVMAALGSGRRLPGLINNVSGKSPDEIVTLAARAGYFGEAAAKELRRPQVIAPELGQSSAWPILYHGSAKPLNGIRPVLFATPDKPTAAFFARLDRKQTRGMRRVTPLTPNFKNPVHVEANGSLINAMGPDRALWRLVEQAQANNNDAIVVHNVIDGPSMDARSVYAEPIDVYIILDPKAVEKLPADYIDAGPMIRGLARAFGSFQLFQDKTAMAAEEVLARVDNLASDVPRNDFPRNAVRVAYPKADPSTRVSAREAEEDGEIKTSWAVLQYRAGRDMIVGEAQGDPRPVRKDIFDLTYEETSSGLFAKRGDIPVGYWIAQREQIIHTLEGDVTAAPGDYVLIGAIGEMWPVKPDKFAQRYDLPSPAETQPDIQPDIPELIAALIADLEGSRQVYSALEPSALPEAQERMSARQWFEARGIDLSADKETIRAQIAAALAADESAPVVHPDEAAPLFGFGSGDELIRALAALKPRAVAIEQRLDEITNRDLGDVGSPDKIKRSAEEAAHVEATARAIEMELAALTRAAGGRVTPANKRAAEAANAMIENMTITEIGDGSSFMAGERRAAKRAFEAAAKGDMVEAARQKGRQLLSFHLYRAAVAASKKAARIRERWDRYASNPTTRAAIGPKHIEQVDAILDMLETGRVTFRPSQSLADWVAEREAAGEVDLLTFNHETLTATIRRPFKQLTWAEVQAVDEAMKNIEAIGRNVIKLRNAREAQRIGDIQETLRTRLLGEWGPQIARNAKRQAPDDARQTMGDTIAHFHANLIKIDYLFRYLDGLKDGGPFMALMNEAQAAENESYDRTRVASRQFLEIVRKHYTDAEFKALMMDRVHIPEIGGDRTKSQMIAYALNMGNEYNRNALMEGEGWTQDQVNAAVRRLDDRDWSFVQALWSYVGKWKEESFALDERTRGSRPPEVIAQPFATPTGRTLSGGYWPVSFSSKRSTRAAQREAEQTIIGVYGAGFRTAATNRGRLKGRVGTGKQALSTDWMGIVARHANDTIRDITHRELVITLRRIKADKGLRDMIAQAAGRDAVRALDEWVFRLAQRTPGAAFGTFDALPRYLRRAGTGFAMGFKVSVAILNIMGHMQAIPRNGVVAQMKQAGLSVAVGFPDLLRRHLQAIATGEKQVSRRVAFVYERSAMMRNRADNFDRDFADARADIVGRRTGTFLFKGFEDTLQYLNQMTDRAVAIPTWLAAYESALNEGISGVTMGADVAANEVAAAAYADSVVRMTLSAGSTKDLAALIGSNNEWQRMFTMFMGWANAFYNQLTLEQFPGVASGKISKAQFAANLIWIWLLPAAITAMFYGDAEREEGEDELAYWARLAITGVVYPLQTIPFVRDLVTATVQGSRPQTPYAAVLDRSARLQSALERQDERQIVKQGYLLAGQLLGVPAQFYTTGDYLVDLARGEEDPMADPADALEEALIRDTR